MQIPNMEEMIKALNSPYKAAAPTEEFPGPDTQLTAEIQMSATEMMSAMFSSVIRIEKMLNSNAGNNLVARPGGSGGSSDIGAILAD
jgi:hypothetical protein